ncbi:BZ3500_MvSof-1268-A1-R1_Chr8-1g09979 [Microbotryum saponariae]|uniref:Enhancer of polycomb-like protein n=1 Tax=Microbotryum saponariae TaxID=289078 RepID=A0A2X0MG25_9BASI|nr:BZ3500_MvSof-1268-A1-R1_Chr8-1g09979 [Microbotryum saponariae]SDA08265.1 BZ3501_MvSof-1269-A2-R1_Chr8-1g09702 [Microbotryum saponariae]
MTALPAIAPASTTRARRFKTRNKMPVLIGVQADTILTEEAQLDTTHRLGLAVTTTQGALSPQAMLVNSQGRENSPMDPLQDGSLGSQDPHPSRVVVGEDERATRGVDVTEEQELHLQLVLRQFSSASFSSTTSTEIIPTSSEAAASADAPEQLSSIPTPSAAGRVDDETYHRLYRSSPPWSHPHTYLRFSDTVQDTLLHQIDYTMDEQDEDWLIAYNQDVARIAKGQPPAGTGWLNVMRRSMVGCEVGKWYLTEDEFELIMDVFEKETDSRGLQSAKESFILPSFAGLAPMFKDPPKTSPNRSVQSKLGPKAEIVYPHWRARRVARRFQPIIPILQQTEGQGDSAYVCFRQRDDSKRMRKTRSSDHRSVDRLLHIRDDLYAALHLFKMVHKREVLKWHEMGIGREVFEKQVEMRGLKRRLGECGGDEELLFRRRPPPVKEAVGAKGVDGPSNDLVTFVAASAALQRAGVTRDSLQKRRERILAIETRIQDDLKGKKREKREWIDVLDDPVEDSHRMGVGGTVSGADFWRVVEVVSSRDQDGKRRDVVGLVPLPLKGVNATKAACFRRRIGRGGRLMLDRLRVRGERPTRFDQLSTASLGSDDNGSGSEESIDIDLWARQIERMRYDDDETSDLSLPEEASPLDDFRLDLTVRRSGLLNFDDIDNMIIDDGYLTRAFEYAATQTERMDVAPETVGPLPRQVLHIVPVDHNWTPSGPYEQSVFSSDGGGRASRPMTPSGYSRRSSLHSRVPTGDLEAGLLPLPFSQGAESYGSNSRASGVYGYSEINDVLHAPNMQRHAAPLAVANGGQAPSTQLPPPYSNKSSLYSAHFSHNRPREARSASIGSAHASDALGSPYASHVNSNSLGGHPQDPYASPNGPDGAPTHSNMTHRTPAPMDQDRSPLVPLGLGPRRLSAPLRASSAMSLSKYTTLSSPTTTSSTPHQPLRPHSASHYPAPASSSISPGSPMEGTQSPRCTSLHESFQANSGPENATSIRSVTTGWTTTTAGMTMHKTKQGAKDDAMIRWA